MSFCDILKLFFVGQNSAQYLSAHSIFYIFMKKASLSCLFLLVGLSVVSAQISFTNQASVLTPAQHFSGVAIAICDMNEDGLDDIVRLDDGTELNIQFQSAVQSDFIPSMLKSIPGNDTWGMCTADVDNDGRGDVLSGGAYNGVKITRAMASGDFNIQNISNPSTFVQGVNLADINNDGWLDAFVCHDDGVSRIFGNNGDGTFTYQPNWIDLTTSPSSDNSGNYGSVWSDVNNDGLTDLYIAKCRQGVNNSSDPRRINQLFLNNGDGTYTQDIANNSGLRIGAQSWTADFGDIDNDGDFDCFITNHDVSSQLLENDGNGHFTDITNAANFAQNIQGTPIQGVFTDFDNDGYLDIVVAGQLHYIFRNNGDKTFSIISNPFNNNEMESFAIGDLNSDGFQDIYGGYAGIYTSPSSTPDALWMNKGNDNHYYALNLRGQQSNRSGVGAKVHLYSALGIQTREVRSGCSYGISNSLQMHFGLGGVTLIDSVVVQWPSGIRDVILQPAVDQISTLLEGGCLTPNVSVVSAGPSTFCSGDSVVLSTSEPFEQYLWSTGETTASITVSQAGAYTVQITNLEACSATASPLIVVINPVQVPSIQVMGDTIFCDGGETILTSTTANAYVWNTGETTQSITVTQAGLYSVAATGLCAVFESEPTRIEVLKADLPLLTPDTIFINETATLIAVGDSIIWYDSPSTPVSIGTGNTLTTGILTQNTTFWATNTLLTGPPNQFVGMFNHQGGTGATSFNGEIIFDCLSPFVLAKTKVIANVAGERQIELRAFNGDLLQSKTIDIPIGTSVIDLNFEVPVGNDLILSTNQTVNMANFGVAGPQMKRSDQGVNYPYEIPNVVRVKDSNSGPQRYYYFFNWEVAQHSLECVSERVPVTVVVNEMSQTFTPSWAKDLRVFPNPTTGQLSVEIQGFTGNTLRSRLQNAQGQTVQTSTHSATAGTSIFQVQLQQFPAGMYWLEIESDGVRVQQKIVLK